MTTFSERNVCSAILYVPHKFIGKTLLIKIENRTRNKMAKWRDEPSSGAQTNQINKQLLSQTNLADYV